MSPLPLPSFPELMQSLGLPKDSQPAISDEGSQCAGSTSSRSPSPLISPKLKERPVREPSPTIVVSQYEADEQPAADDGQPGGFKRRASSGSIKSTRYSPYANRVSATDHQRDEGQTANHRGHRKTLSSSSSRRSSAGSLSASSASGDSIPPLPARRARGGSLERLKVHSAAVVAAAASTPISSFARRRSPQVSPTSPSFSSRERSADLPSPVMLPSLPPMLAASFATFAFPDPSAAASARKSKAGSVKEREMRRSTSRSPRTHAMDIDEKENVFVKHHQAGLRISSFHRQVAPIA